MDNSKTQTWTLKLMKSTEELPLQQHPGTESKFLEEEQNINLIFLLINIRYKKAKDKECEPKIV